MSEARTDKLQGIWAEDATVVSSTPPTPATGTAYRNTSSDATVGHKFNTKSASEISNQFLYTVSKLLDQIQVHGTLGWNATTTYPVGSIAFGSDNQVYICILEALNKDPTSETTYWVKLDIANRALITLANITTVPTVADGNLKTAPDVVTSYWVASDGQSWYRKYKSGWVEQGGWAILLNGYATVQLPVSFTNSEYYATTSSNWSNNVMPDFRSADIVSIDSLTNTSFRILGSTNADTPVSNGTATWEAKGLGA